MKKPLTVLIGLAKPFLESLPDPIAILDEHARIIHANPLMRSFLQLRPRQISENPVFCSTVKLGICSSSCALTALLKNGEKIALDETPASVGGQKYRILLRATALKAPGNDKPLGIFVTLRDTSPEIIVHAKYHKAVELLQDRDYKIDELKDTILQLRRTISGMRGRT